MEKEDKELPPPTIDPSLLECSICLLLLVEPITIPCGHTFCRSCVVASQQRAKKSCPLCRAVCVIDATSHNESTHLSRILKTCFPTQYAQRLQDLAEIKKEWQRTLPIFFYNNTMFPGQTLRLHLFEPRYKIMIRRVLEGNRQFVYLPRYTSYKPEVGAVGIIAQVINCQFSHDGRAGLEAKMLSRVVLTDHWTEEDTSQLHYCTFEEMKDTDSEEERRIVNEVLSKDVREHLSSLKQLVASLEPGTQYTVKEVLGEWPSESSSPEVLGWWMIGALDTFSEMPEQQKHQLLCTKSAAMRLEVVNMVFKSMRIVRGTGANDTGNEPEAMDSSQQEDDQTNNDTDSGGNPENS